jgi:hypothetical protein
MRSGKKAGLSTRCDVTRGHVMISNTIYEEQQIREAIFQCFHWIMMRCTRHRCCALLTFKTRGLTRISKKETQGLCTMRDNRLKGQVWHKHCQRKEKNAGLVHNAFMWYPALRGHTKHRQSRHIKNRITTGPATQMQQKDTKALS